MAKKFICSQCGQTFEAASMPDKCPICGADASHIKEVKSKGINTNGNVYTICYAAVMVVVVAFLLAYVSSALKPAQDANVAIDKRTQILASLNVRGIAKSDVEAKYNELIKETCVLTPDGQIIEGADAFDVDTKEIGEKFPVYSAKTADGQDAFVLPLKGRGLWGGIWGYVAVTPDCKQVLGAFFNHESETAGLGALIKDEPFQSQFIGRPVLGEDGKVALTVVKKGESKAEAEVDGVTGATLTSKGVGEMVQTGIQQYIDAFQAAGKAQHEGCGQHEDCGDCADKAAAHKCESGSDCCQSGVCDKSGSCGKPGCDGDKACCGER